jgi:hypothetical protein
LSGVCGGKLLRFRGVLRELSRCSNDSNCAQLADKMGSGCAFVGNLEPCVPRSLATQAPLCWATACVRGFCVRQQVADPETAWEQFSQAVGEYASGHCPPLDVVPRRTPSGG